MLIQAQIKSDVRAIFVASENGYADLYQQFSQDVRLEHDDSRLYHLGKALLLFYF